MNRSLEPTFLAPASKSRQVAFALWDLFCIWSVIFGVGGLHLTLFKGDLFDLPLWAKPVITVLTLLTIASRQHALMGLVHEAAHSHLLPGKWNDVVSDWLCAFPLLVVTRFYRRFHLAHHRYVNTEDDPDWNRNTWTFPKSSKASVWGFVLKEAFVTIGRRFRIFGVGLVERPVYSLILVSHVLGGALIGWQNYLLFWLCPMLFFLPVLALFRSMSEHFGLTFSGDLQQSRDVEAGFIERALFGPVMMNLHLTHHLYPGVPRYRLREVHAKITEEPWYREGAKRSSSYILPSRKSVLSELVVPQE